MVHGPVPKSVSGASTGYFAPLVGFGCYLSWLFKFNVVFVVGKGPIYAF